MAQRLSGKVAIVTASTKGIGYAIAKKLGLDGAKVVVSSRKGSNVTEAVDGLKASGVVAEGTVCHVGLAEDRQKLIDFALKKHGKIDILVSNAAVNPHYGDILEVSDKQWDKLFDTNVRAAFLLSKAVVPHMESAGGGNIVFVSSITGYTPFVGIGAYGVTKTALLGLTKALAQSLAHRNIRVNGIAPGIIRTDFSKAMWDKPTADAEQAIRSMIPLGRLGEPDDCAGLVSFLVSDDAKYITGETVMVTGGISARL